MEWEKTVKFLWISMVYLQLEQVNKKEKSKIFLFNLPSISGDSPDNCPCGYLIGVNGVLFMTFPCRDISFCCGFVLSVGVYTTKCLRQTSDINMQVALWSEYIRASHLLLSLFSFSFIDFSLLSLFPIFKNYQFFMTFRTK